MTEEKKFHRKILLINKPIQYQMIKDICIVPMVCFALVSLTAVACFWAVMRMEDASSLDLPSVYGLIVSLLSLVFIASCIITVRTAIHVSHRVAGSLYRLHQGIDQVRTGDVSFRIHFRKKDYVKDTAWAFNKLIDYIEELQLAKRGSKWDVNETVPASAPLETSPEHPLSEVDV